MNKGFWDVYGKFLTTHWALISKLPFRAESEELKKAEAETYVLHQLNQCAQTENRIYSRHINKKKRAVVHSVQMSRSNV
jgi:hypothetical protein